MNRAFLDKLISRIGRVQPDEVQSLLADLANEKGFLETIFNAIYEGIIVVDTTGRILYINRAAASFFGVDATRQIGHDIAVAIPGMSREILAAGSGTATRDLEVFHPEHRLLNFYLVGLRDTAGGHTGAVMILRDITQTQRATEENIESEKLSALTLLAAGVAHEVGNPLNSLGIHLQLLERKIKTLAESERSKFSSTIEIARREVTRLDQILTQFLKAIRPQPLTLIPTNLNVLVTECLDFLNAEIYDRDISVETDLAADFPLLPADPVQIKQAIYNIVRNALQAMPRGGILRIGTRFDEVSASISFADTGAGISPEDIGRIFEPYYTTKKQGSGLGLLIVNRIMRSHGGRIAVESIPSKGSTITLDLPRHDTKIKLLP